jgi:hypothetical protein
MIKYKEHYKKKYLKKNNSIYEMSSTLEYGYVIKIVSSDRDSTYDGKYFFVERLHDDQLVLLSDKETITLGITDQELDDKKIEKLIIVYKPRKDQGFIFQNKLFVGQTIDIEFDNSKVIGKIKKMKDQVIEVEPNTVVDKDGAGNAGSDILYIPLDRGLPKQIVSIKALHIKPKEKDKEVHR